MEMASSRLIPAPPDAVWRALNDPAALKECIPGCESLERSGEEQWRAALATKVGPVSAKFAGTMRMEDIMPPTGYTLKFEGQGGAAGFANGEAKIALAPEGGQTRLSYVVKAQVGGKLAQIGSRLIDGAAAKLADDFFARFEAHFAPTEATAAAIAGAAAPAISGAARVTSGRLVRYVAIAAILALLAILYAKGGRLW
jgi:carbon monoxide dehydrogenase subunit G